MAAPAGRADARRPLLRGVRARLRPAPHVLRQLARLGARAPRAGRRRVRACSWPDRSRSCRSSAKTSSPASTRGSSSSTCAASPGRASRRPRRSSSEIEDSIRTVIPAAQTQTMIDNIGIPYSGINLSLSEGALVSPADGEIFIALKEGHPPTAGYVHKLRSTLAAAFPEQTFFFLAPDISTQVLNFGLAAPIDVQVVGADRQRGADRGRRPEDRRAGQEGPRRGRRAPRAGAQAARRSASTSTGRWPPRWGSPSGTSRATSSCRWRRARSCRRATGSTSAASSTSWPSRLRSTTSTRSTRSRRRRSPPAATGRSCCRTSRRSRAPRGR